MFFGVFLLERPPNLTLIVAKLVEDYALRASLITDLENAIRAGSASVVLPHLDGTEAS